MSQSRTNLLLNCEASFQHLHLSLSTLKFRENGEEEVIFILLASLSIVLAQYYWLFWVNSTAIQKLAAVGSSPERKIFRLPPNSISPDCISIASLPIASGPRTSLSTTTLIDEVNCVVKGLKQVNRLLTKPTQSTAKLFINQFVSLIVQGDCSFFGRTFKTSKSFETIRLHPEMPFIMNGSRELDRWRMCFDFWKFTRLKVLKTAVHMCSIAISFTCCSPVH